MKKQSNALVGILSALAVILILGVVISEGPRSADALPLTVQTLPNSVDGYLTYAPESMDLVNDNLLEPLREKFGIENPNDAFSRCASSVDYTIQSAESTDGYYYGDVTKFIGCGEESGSYSYRVEAATGIFELQDAEGDYVSVEDWEPTEE